MTKLEVVRFYNLFSDKEINEELNQYKGASYNYALFKNRKAIAEEVETLREIAPKELPTDATEDQKKAYLLENEKFNKFLADTEADISVIKIKVSDIPEDITQTGIQAIEFMIE